MKSNINKVFQSFELGMALEKARISGLGAKELAVMLGAHYDKATLSGLVNELYKQIKRK